MFRSLPLTLLTVLMLTRPTPALEPDEDLNKLLKPIRTKHDLPGLVAGVVRGDKLVWAGAVGVRKEGSDVPITVNDKLHLGSCSKALTATMIATLIEEGKLSWETTLAKAFPDEKNVLHADLRDVTLEQLLTHRSGLAANADYLPLVQAASSGQHQRRALFRKVLREAPEAKPGSKFLYSNLGYCVATMMAETVTRKPWEDLMRERLYKPLGLTSAGFGPPGGKGRVDQPWGHQTKSLKNEPNQEDNPLIIWPAGSVHLSLADWARFAVLHMRGVKGQEKLLTKETFQRLHKAPPGERYSCGWIVVEQPWTRGKGLNHAGSNTLWYVVIWLAPGRDLAFLAATNLGGKAGELSTNDAIAAMAEVWLKKLGD